MDPNERSWFVKDVVCVKCGYSLIITQPTEPYQDYWWYCSNKTCEHHHPGEQCGDQEDCFFAFPSGLVISN